MTWEYKRITYRDFDTLDKQITVLGLCGWELVAVGPFGSILKRPITLKDPARPAAQEKRK